MALLEDELIKKKGELAAAEKQALPFVGHKEHLDEWDERYRDEV